MRAFASGCTAMTGVEAVSNGVTAFREPAVRHAQRTLTAIIGLLAVMLAGIAYLCRAYTIGATEPGQAGYQSILSQLVAAVVGRGVFYYITIGSVLSVLALSANTGFADFPRLCRVIASDGFLPSGFAHRGRRLVYSQGIIVLAVLSAGLLIAFGGITDHLIPLFAVGAFLAFTLSQAGMVVHWRRLGGPHARKSMAINAAGAVCTGVTLVVVLVSKFLEGAWVMILLIPALLVLFYSVRAHYQKVGREVASDAPLDAPAWSRRSCCCRSGAGVRSPARRFGSPSRSRTRSTRCISRATSRRWWPSKKAGSGSSESRRRQGGLAGAQVDHHLFPVPPDVQAADRGCLGPEESPPRSRHRRDHPRARSAPLVPLRAAQPDGRRHGGVPAAEWLPEGRRDQCPVVFLRVEAGLLSARRSFR